MKINAILVALLLFSFPATKAAAQNAPSDAAPAGAQASADAATPIDPQKEADIRKLLAMTGAATTGKQMMDNLEANMRPALIRSLPPGDYREKLLDLFFQKFTSEGNVQQILDITVRVYDKYLSDDDIKGLITFYSTPLGRKAISVFPKLALESQTEGMKWGQQMGQQAMRDTLAEHPDLARAMQDAIKAAKPPQ